MSVHEALKWKKKIPSSVDTSTFGLELLDPRPKFLKKVAG